MSRTQKKKLATAQSVVGPEITVLAYGDGVGHARFPKVAIWILAIYALLAVVVLLTTGKIIFPGLLLLLVLAAVIQPRRGLAVTPLGVALMRVSMWNAQPRLIMFTAPSSVLAPPATSDIKGNKVRIVIGAERIKMKRRDYDLLASAVQHSGQISSGYTVNGSQPSTPAGWFTDPTGRAEHRYWDGEQWTPHVSQLGVQSLDPP